MLALDVIDPVQTKLQPPGLLCLGKREHFDSACRTHRLRMDYQNLDVINLPDSYPAPRMNDCNDSFAEPTIFSTLEANCGNWEAEVDSKDLDRTGIGSFLRLSQFTRTLFGKKRLREFPTRTGYNIILA